MMTDDCIYSASFHSIPPAIQFVNLTFKNNKMTGASAPFLKTLLGPICKAYYSGWKSIISRSIHVTNSTKVQKRFPANLT